MLYLSLRVVHIAFVVLFFAAGITLSSDVRRTLAAKRDLDGLRARMRQRNILGRLGGIGAILSGLALIHTLGGFAVVPIAVHIGLALTLVALVIGWRIEKAWTALDQAVTAGSPDADAKLVRLRVLNVSFHATWATTLVLMVFRHATAMPGW